MKDEIRDVLETKFVDEEGLANTVLGLRDICRLKAEYIRANFIGKQKEAQTWEELADIFDRLWDNTHVRAGRAQGYIP